MKLEDLPEFARPYKTKGYDVRKRGNSFALFKISSKRVKGKKYPVLNQKYIGVIDPVKGLIESSKNDNLDKTMVEYGLTSIIYKNFFNDICNASYGSRDKTFVKLCIIHYVFGNIEERTLRLTHLSVNDNECFITAEKITIDRVIKISRVIDKLLKERIKDESDLLYIINASKMIMVDSDIKYIQEKECPEELMEVLDKYGLFF